MTRNHHDYLQLKRYPYQSDLIKPHLQHELHDDKKFLNCFFVSDFLDHFSNSFRFFLSLFNSYLNLKEKILNPLLSFFLNKNIYRYIFFFNLGSKPFDHEYET